MLAVAHLLAKLRRHLASGEIGVPALDTARVAHPILARGGCVHHRAGSVQSRLRLMLLLLCLIEPHGWIRFDAAAAPLPAVCEWGCRL